MRYRLVLAVLLLPAAAGCRRLPESQWSELQRTRQDLRLAHAEAYLPEQHASFEREFDAIERDYAREADRLALFRDSEGLTKRIDRARANGRLLKRELRIRTEKLRTDQRVRIGALQAEVEAWRSSTLHPEPRKPIAQLEMGLKKAQSYWEQGEYSRVAELLGPLETERNGLHATFEKLRLRYSDPKMQGRWTTWIAQTIRWSARTGRQALIVDKLHRRARVYQSGKLLHEFPADLGWNQFPDKAREGDGATPEGRYRVKKKKGAGETKYHLALLLDYPDAADWREFRQARQRGELTADARLGGLIEVHGEGGRGRDWTEGCVALLNADMETLFRIAYIGMPVTIVGSTGDGQPQ